MLHIYRPDAVTRTSVVQPWNIQQTSPVQAVYGVLQAFVQGMGSTGQSIVPQGAAEAGPRIEVKSGPTSGGLAGGGGRPVISAPPRGAIQQPQGTRPIMAPPQLPRVQGMPGTSPTVDPLALAAGRSVGLNMMFQSNAPVDALGRRTVMHAMAGQPFRAMYPEVQRAIWTRSWGNYWQNLRATQDIARTYTRGGIPQLTVGL